MKRRRTPDASLTLAQPRAVHALASPHRLEIIAALGDAKTASIAELARRLGRTPHSLYFHMKRLAEAGVAVPAETRRRGRRDEQVWTLAAQRIEVGPADGATPFGIEASKAVDSMLRLTSRELRLALQRQGTRRGRPTLVGMRMKGRVDGPTLRRITLLIRQIEALVRQANRRQASGPLYALTVVLTPAADRTQKEM